MVKNQVEKDLAAAADIQAKPSRANASDFPVEVSSQNLTEYRTTLAKMEKLTQQQWQEIMSEVRDSSRSSARTSWIMFGVSIAFLVTAFALLIFSNKPQQQLPAAIAAALAFVTLYRQQLWKGSAEQVQDLSTQQARLQAALVGYVNRVAQLRLVFEDMFAKQEIGVSELERFQCLLGEATEQAWQQVKGQTEDDDLF